MNAVSLLHEVWIENDGRGQTLESAAWQDQMVMITDDCLDLALGSPTHLGLVVAMRR